MKEEVQLELPEPSEEFLNALVKAGSVSIDCDFCGRVHFGNGEFMEDGEYERLLKLSEEEPNKYIGHSESDVSWGILGGRKYVAGCPCNSATRYENFLWEHRKLIADYFLARTESELRGAQENSRLAKSISENVKP